MYTTDITDTQPLPMLGVLWHMLMVPLPLPRPLRFLLLSKLTLLSMELSPLPYTVVTLHGISRDLLLTLMVLLSLLNPLMLPVLVQNIWLPMLLHKRTN